MRHPFFPGRFLWVRLAILFGLLGGFSVFAYAETAPDTLVQARALGDFASFDPAEAFEIGTAEILASSYQRLLRYPPEAEGKIRMELARSWEQSPDGRTTFFDIAPGHFFASGRPVQAEDVVFSLRRAVRLGKTPSVLLRQLGLEPENVEQTIRLVQKDRIAITTRHPFPVSFLFACLSTTVASVVDRVQVLEHEVDGDLGNSWLRTAHAGSGPFVITQWYPRESLLLERNPNYGGTPPFLHRILYRHVPESATQALMLQRGDVDVARDLAPADLKSLRSKNGIRVIQYPTGTLIYLALNRAHPALRTPGVLQALRLLIDYDLLTEVLIGGWGTVQQTFLPAPIEGALVQPRVLHREERNVEKARRLLAEAGYPEGFSVHLDVWSKEPFLGIAQAIKRDFARASVEVKLNLLHQKQLLLRYRNRQHQMTLARWGLHYRDPHANAQAFAFNPDAGENSAFRTLAWRNGWRVEALNSTVQTALWERDPAKRAERYRDLQKQVYREGPFLILYRKIGTAASHERVQGLQFGVSPDSTEFLRTRKE